MLQKIKRIEVGVTLATIMGVLYAFISQTINLIILKDIPLHTVLPSPWVMIPLIILICTILGFLASVVDDIVYSSILAASVGAAFITMKAYLTDPATTTSFIAVIATFFTQFVPSAILLFLLALLLRWSIKQLLDNYYQVDTFTFQRYLPVLFPLLSAAFIGGLALKNGDFRRDMRLVDAALKEANQALTIAGLPEGLQEVDGFFIHRNEPYTLEPSSDVDLYTGEPPVGVREADKGIVLVHYLDGFTVTCLTIEETDRLLCEPFVPLSQREE